MEDMRRYEPEFSGKRVAELLTGKNEAELFIGTLSERDIEVSDPTALADSLHKLMTKYEIDATYLDEHPSAAMLLAGVAAEGDAERADVVARAILRPPIEEGDDARDAVRWAAIERFTNRELSEELAKVMDGPLFGDIRVSLVAEGRSITEIADIRVVDVAHEGATGLPGLLQLDGEEQTLYDEHRANLLRNAKEFSRQTGSFAGKNTMPPAWMRPAANGRKSTVFIPALVAETIVVKSETAAELTDDAKREFVEPRHELVHCLESLFLQEGFYAVGLLLEERRAEYFSGDKSGYLDVKQAVKFVLDMAGTDIDELYPKDGTFSADTLYAHLAAKVGLETMLDLATALPQSYKAAFSGEEGFGKEYLEAGNDINDAILRILRREKERGGQPGAEAMVSAYVDAEVQRLQELGTELPYMCDVFAYSGPTALAILMIKDFQERYPDASTYDWQSAYGEENWALTI